MGTDVLGVSISGLRVSQNALRTTGHNIANANTEGYSRQRTEINSSGGSFSGVGFLGNGAHTQRVERVINEFVTSQIRHDSTLHQELDVYHEKVSQLSDILSNESIGLTQGLQSFFSAVQNATDDPTSLSSRQVLITEVDNLSNRFNSLYSSIERMDSDVRGNLSAAVNNVNSLSENIALLNRKISEATAGSEKNIPNDLLDQRDLSLRELSKLVSIKVVDQGDNQVNVVVGTGTSLVVGSRSEKLAISQNVYDPLRSEISLVDSISVPITHTLSGGEIGGLLDFQQTVIDPSLNDLGRVGLVLADNFNQLQKQGITLDSSFGQNMFFDINSSTISGNRILANINNVGTSPKLSLSITDTSQLTSSDYLFEINSTSNVYKVTRLSDNAEVSSSIMPVNFPTSITFDGLSFDIAAGTATETFESGDKFLIQPTRLGARDFSSQSLQAEGLALGSPILTDSTLGNIGSGSISAGEVLGLVDASGTDLPLLAQEGKMSPPLLVKFTTATTYDILDNSDPGNPVSLSPPIRNQVYVPGIPNRLFSDDIGQTIITSNGTSLGMPANSKASLQPAGAAPNFAVTDFSGSGDQFAFDVVVTNTVGAANDGTFTVTIDSASITDTATLLADINDDLAASRVRAHIDDSGSLAFLALDNGAGDITLQNYDADPDGGADNAPAGQADTLLGFAIETTSFTTVADANGISGVGTTANDYPAETFTFVTTDPTTGASSSQNTFSSLSASARSTAGILDNVEGVTATAFNYAELRDFSLSPIAPLQITLNNEDLVEYEGGIVHTNVPSPATNNGEDFNDYLVDAVNNNENLKALGIYAVSAYDASNSEFYIQLHSTQGDDFNIQLESVAGESIEVNDGTNPDNKLIGVGAGTVTEVTVGGRIDITLAENVTLSTTPANSGILGDSTAANYSLPSYLGIQANMAGNPEAGDTFTIDFNTDAALDNRNGLAMVELQQSRMLDNGEQTYSDSYGQLVEDTGIKAHTSQNNLLAAEHVLEQSINLRNATSGVNLDEEAADLIRFEQLYSANAQVISVAREIFDRLLNSF